MTGFWVADIACLVAILVGAGLVLRLDTLNAAVAALSATGTVLALLFVVLGAPDVAHSQVIVGTVALPALYLVAIGKVRTDVADDRGDLGESSGPGDQGAQEEGAG